MKLLVALLLLTVTLFANIPQGNLTSDALGRTIARIDPLGHTVRWD